MSTIANAFTANQLRSAIVRNPLVVSAETPVMEAIANMSGMRTICASDRSGEIDNVHQEARSSCVLVMESDNIIGILTERDVVRLSAQQRSLNDLPVSEVMTSPVATLRESEFTDLFSAVNLLQQRRIRHMPIIDRNDRLLGIITHESLRQLARPIDLLRLRLVSEVMTVKMICAEPSTSMLVIAQLMSEHRVGSVLIVENVVESQVDPDGNALQIPLGIITERDIVQFQAIGLQLERVEVQAVMSTPVFAVRPDDTLMVVQQIMEQRSIRRLVVTGTQGELLGVVTQTSLLQILNPLELYNLSKILEQKVSQLETEKVKLLEDYTSELERQVGQRTVELHARVEREQLIARIAAKIAASLYLPEILETAVQELRTFLSCDRTIIWQFNSDWTGTIVSESVGSLWRASLHDTIDDPCFRGDLVQQYNEGHAIAIANIHNAGYPDCYIQLLEEYQVKANLVLPIRVSGRLWGLLIAHQCDDYREWLDSDLTLLDDMSVQLAIAIQQAEAHHQAQIELVERQRAELCLRDSEQRFRAIFNNSFQFIGLLTLDGTLLEANQTALTIGGISHEDVVGRPFWEAYWWQISSEAQVQLQQAIARAANGEFVRYEVDIWGANQTVIPVEFSLRPIFDDSDRIVLLISEGRDLRKLKLREAELKQSEQRFVSLATAAPVGIYRTDEIGNCTYVNDRWCQIVGLKLEAAAGFGWINGIHPSDRELVSAEWNASVAANRPFKLEYRFQNAEGQITWALGQSEAERNESGEIIGYVGTITDISDRKSIEEQAQHRLEILESARDIIASVDSAGKVTYLNHAARELLGFALDEDVSQTHISDYHSPEMANFIRQEAIPQCLQQGFWTGETRFRRRDGSEIPVLQTIVSHRQQDGTVCHLSTIAVDISDRKKAEAERLIAEQISQELKILEEVFDTVLAGYWDWDLQNNEEYLSPKFKKMFGYEDDELPSSPESWQHLIFAEDFAKVLDCFDRHVQSRGEIPFYNEARYRHKDGSTVWVICSGQVIEWDATDKPLRMIGCHIDISDRKQAEIALRESDAFNRSIFENSADCIEILDLDDELTKMNCNGTYLMEIDDFSCWVGRTWVDAWQEPYKSLAVQALKDAKNGDTGHFEGFCPTAKGTPKWWDVLVTAVRDADGNLLRLIATSRDITASKQVEERLRKSDAHLKTAQRIGKLGSWEFEPSSGKIIWSDEIFQIFGRDPALSPPTFAEIQQYLHPDDRDNHQQLVETSIANCQPFENEVRFYRVDGSLGYFQTRGEAIVDDAGQLTLLVGTILDITDRKLAETKLMQTTAQLSASNRELEAFAYSVSHDLRSPLRAIDGFSKVLVEDYGDKFDENALDYFDRIRRNVVRMGDLIEDLLRLSRVSRCEIQYRNVNLTQLVQEQVDELQAINPERQVEIAIAPNVIVSADITLMRVIISNLIQNAWKFTSNHATARIEFGVIPPESKSDEFIYFVRDDGAGFNMDYVNNLFGVFQRLHNTNEFAGTGIGLATVQRAIHRHGGKIWAEGAIEQGATIYFTVPDS